MVISNRTSKTNASVPAESGDPAVSQSETTRRRFLELMIGVLSALVTSVVAIPFIGSVIGPSFRTKKLKWVKVGDISSWALNKPANLKFSYKTEDAYIRETVTRSVWVIKHSSSRVTAFSPICPHLGCHYDWHPTQNEFICPCHGSVYSIDGKVLGGPSPRSLDTLPTKSEGGELFVEWETFKVGIPQKIAV